MPANLGSKRPLLISCHGASQDAAYQKNMLQVESVADTAKFLTVFPNGINKMWDISGDSDIEFIKALITKMVKDYDIDVNRVYLSGFSMGGMFTYHAMNKIADKIAAFAPISGYPLYGSAVYTSSRPHRPINHPHHLQPPRTEGDYPKERKHLPHQWQEGNEVKNFFLQKICDF